MGSARSALLTYVIIFIEWWNHEGLKALSARVVRAAPGTRCGLSC